LWAAEQGWKIGLVLRQGALVVLMIGLAPACGRIAMDEGRTPAASGGAGTRVPPDLPPPAFPCADLQPLADGVLTPRHVVRVLFAPDRSSLVLQVKGEGPSGSSLPDNLPDDLLLVRLPSGEVSPIISSVASTVWLQPGASRWIASPEWLQPGATLLVGAVRDGKIDLVVVGSDGSGLRTLIQGVCDYVAAPDGSRVYVTHDCDQYRHGAIDVVDVASGASTRLAVYGDLRTSRGKTVSPDGRWAAFQTFIPLNSGANQWVLAVGNADGQVDTLVSQPGASDPGFVSDRLLLFQTGTEIRGHVPGSGDTSYLVADNRGYGYQVSPDGKWLLGANASQTNASLCVTKLYATRLDGTGELLLASDPNNCLPHPQMVPPRDFAFSAHGRAIFDIDQHFGVATVGLDGGKPTVLSHGAYFLEAPWLDQVALFEWTSRGSAAPRLRLVDLGSATDVFAYDLDSDGDVQTIGFPPSGRGLVFTESRSSGPSRLRYASADRSVVLGEWQITQFVPDSWSNTPPLATYPLDPTGCFTVFDTDLAPGPGTRLALLPQ
jgi:Tol biopolymer transport system component